MIVLNAKFNIGLDKLTFKSPQENVNQFIQNVDSSNGNYTMGKEKVGVDLFDDNRITGDMLSELGDKEYLVYVFIKPTSNTAEMTPLDKMLMAYKGSKDALPVYALDFQDLIGTDDAYLMEDAPVLLKFTRSTDEHGKISTLTSGIYKTPGEFKKHMGLENPTKTDKSTTTKPTKESTEKKENPVEKTATTSDAEESPTTFSEKIKEFLHNWR